MGRLVEHENGNGWEGEEAARDETPEPAGAHEERDDEVDENKHENLLGAHIRRHFFNDEVGCVY